MFKDLFRQELIYWLKNPVTYCFTLIFCTFAFLMFIGSAGWFDPHVTDNHTHLHLNGHFSINNIVQYLHKLLLIMLPAIVGSALFKDYKYRMHSLLFTFPIHKTSYLLARFLAAFTIVLGIGGLIILSLMIASLIPGLDPAKTGSFQLVAFLQPYWLYMVPNLLFTGALVMMIVLIFRNIYAAFLITLLPFLMQLISENAFPQSPDLMASLDPFGQNTLLYTVRNWTLTDKNELALPMSRLILCNRLGWTTLSILIIGLSIGRFRLHEQASSWSGIRIFKREKERHGSIIGSTDYQLKDLNLSPKNKSSLHTLWHLSKDGLIYALKNPLFWGILALAILALFFAVNRVTRTGDMLLMPATKIMIMVPAAFYSVFCMLLIFLYTGLLINRERSARIHQLVDCSPTPFWVIWSSKLLTMVQLEALLLALFILSGITIQTWQGYTDYEVLLYLKHLIGFVWPPLILWTLAAFFIHTLIDNLYVALFILLFGWVGVAGLPQLGIDSFALRFNTAPDVQYSDLNGYGHHLKGFFATQGYWQGFGIVLLVAAHIIWPYGVIIPIKDRMRNLRKRLSTPVLVALFTGVAIMGYFGWVIILGEQSKIHSTNAFSPANFQSFQKTFQPYTALPTPKIRKAQIAVELFPDDQNFTAAGHYIIENPHAQAIDTLLVRLGYDEITSFDLNIPYEIVAADSGMQCYALKLKNALAPADTFELSFKIQNQANTLFERNSNILKNGTFLKHDIFPRLGYTFDEEWPHPEDTTARQYHYQGPDADLVNLSMIIGTASDQIAIGPGKLVRQWKSIDRTYFEYLTEQPVKFSFGINSGKYQIRESQVQDKVLTSYSHHTANLASIQHGINATLSYQSQYFQKYSYPNIRVIEFPDSEGSYATAFVNNIPMSEIRFISKADPTGAKTDLSFYVPAHELIHHWWGATLMPARTKGAHMLTESITEYLTLQVYKQAFGSEAALNFLRLQHQRYWHGHNRETSLEPPLHLVDDTRTYISYGKGTVVLNGLGQLLGEDTLNGLLADFLHQHANGHPPYPTSTLFLQHLYEQLPDSIQGFVRQQFETVSYLTAENLKASFNSNPQKETITLSGNVNRRELRHLDASAAPETHTIDEWIEVALYDEDDEKMATHWLHLTDASFEVQIKTRKKPNHIVLDPHYLLLIKQREKTRTTVMD